MGWSRESLIQWVGLVADLLISGPSLSNKHDKHLRQDAAKSGSRMLEFASLLHRLEGFSIINGIALFSSSHHAGLRRLLVIVASAPEDV